MRNLLRYGFYSATRYGVPIDCNVIGPYNSIDFQVIKLAECFSDRTTISFPRAEEGLKMEALTAIAKLSILIDQGKIQREIAPRINAVAISFPPNCGVRASFDELAEFIEEMTPQHPVIKVNLDELVSDISRNMPFFSAFRRH